MDGERQRNLWLSSMSQMPKRKPENVVLSRVNCQELPQETDVFAGALERPQTKAKSFHEQLGSFWLLQEMPSQGSILVLAKIQHNLTEHPSSPSLKWHIHFCSALGDWRVCLIGLLFRCGNDPSCSRALLVRQMCPPLLPMSSISFVDTTPIVLKFANAKPLIKAPVLWNHSTSDARIRWPCHGCCHNLRCRCSRRSFWFNNSLLSGMGGFF